jgi:xanthosine utilization system XapX-like protein
LRAAVDLWSGPALWGVVIALDVGSVVSVFGLLKFGLGAPHPALQLLADVGVVLGEAVVTLSWSDVFCPVTYCV